MGKGTMNAYDIMHEWDRASGTAPRSNEELDKEVPPLLGGADYEEWKKRLEKRDIEAITLGMRCWDLPIGPLGQFEVDEGIETEERHY